jgi:hypothetical protein
MGRLLRDRLKSGGKPAREVEIDPANSRIPDFPFAQGSILPGTPNPEAVPSGRADRNLGEHASSRRLIAMLKLDCLLELLGRPERHFLAGLDLDLLTRCRIAAHPLGTLLHLQGAEAAHPDPSALF